MAVGIFVEPDFYTIGIGNFLFCFFSNIAYHLENGQWGNRFPYLMKHLYDGLLEKQYVGNAIDELHTVKKEFSYISPQKVIWDIEDLSQQPPWGNDILEDITDLSNYFVTSEGEELFDVLFKAFGVAKDDNENIEIKQL